MNNKIRILFCCSAQADYPRNIQILQSLRVNYDVISIVSESNSYFLRIVEVFLRCLREMLFGKYDVVYAGFLGQPLVLWFSLFSRKPVILDAFISVYDTLCLDRKDFSKRSFAGIISFYLDKLSFLKAKRIVVDTNANSEYFSSVFKINKDKFIVIYPGAVESLFFPAFSRTGQGETEPGIGKKKFLVLTHGTFLPLHGTEYIIKAASLLDKEQDIVIKIIGGGRVKEEICCLARNLGVENIEFIPWTSYEDLAANIAEADLCLGGHFSGIDKALRVISGKTFLYMAMQKPVIVGDNSATRELFTHFKNSYICPMADERSLADAIMVLKHKPDLRGIIAAGGRKLYEERISQKKSSEILALVIKEIGL